jgi:general secretion pathway protein D
MTTREDGYTAKILATCFSLGRSGFHARSKLTQRPQSVTIHSLLHNTVQRFLCSGVLSLAAAAAGFGQVAPGAQTSPEPPAVAQNQPVVAPQAPARNAPAPPTRAANTPPPAETPVRLQFPNSDVADVLHLYEQLTGKKLVMDNFVQGKVNIFISKDVPREEAIRIIEINLLMNGYSLVPSDNDIVKVIGTGKNPRTAGVPIVSDESEIPEGDHVISYLFKLRYADPTELQQALGQYLSPPQPYTSFLALPKSGSLLITENSSVIRTIARIIDQVDSPPAEVVSEFIKLERADASKVCEMLKDIFEKGDKTGQPGYPGGVRGVRQPGANVPQPVNVESDVGALTALTEESVVVGKIKLNPDVRTNRIHVITRPVNMPFVRKLISEFDANVEFAKPVTRPLRYISAADVLPVIVQALSEPGATGQGAEGAGAAPGASPTQPRRTPTGTGTSGGYAGTTSSTSGTGGTGGDSTLNVSEELQTQPVDTTPKAVTVGNAKIIADQRANTIIVLGNREVVVKVQKILDEMDVKAPQVAISTVIGELTLTQDEEFGVDYFVRANKRVAGTTNFTGVPPFPGGGTTTSSPVAGGSPVVTTTGGNVFDPGNLISFTQLATNAATGANIYLAAGNTLASVVHVLESTGRFRVVNRPIVFTSNNKKAIIASGTEIPVPVSTLSSVVNAAGVTGTPGTSLGQQSNIEFKKVALQLEVVPLINSESEVSLDILQKLDSLAGSQVIDGNSIPTIATRYVRTNVSAPSGTTIVLGGLITESVQKNTNGVPILDRIPYLGALFRDTKISKMRVELIILMCPQVTLTKLDLYRLRQETEDRTHFGPEIDQGGCPDCPPRAGEGKQLEKLPPPDLPSVKDVINNGK